MTLEKTLRGVVLAAVFALPFLALYVSYSMFFPFITGKNFAFRILVEVAASGWIALAFLNPAYRPKKQWLLWAFSALVIIMAAADAFGVYPFKSFWSNFERMDGFVTLAHLFAYFVVAVSVLNTEKLWRAWWHTTLGVSTLVAFIGIFQLLGFIGINQSGTRLDARLGNSTYLGVYMLFHVFMAALLLARKWVNEPRNRRAAAWLYGLSIALNTFVLFFTATRGAMLGLIGGAAFAGLIVIFFNPRSKVAKMTAAALAALILLSGVFYAARHTAFVQNIEPLHRLASILEDTTTFSRFMNWGMAWQGVQERPILGWGHENYSAVFDKYYDPGMYGQEPWFDRTHNIIFDWLIAGGILGLLAYLSLYVFALLAVWRSGAFEPYERAILTGLFAGYFFYLLFTFDNLTSYILFVAVLAYIAMRAGEGKIGGAWKLPRTAAPVAAGAAAILAAALIYFVNVPSIQQNRALIAAMRPSASGAAGNLALFQTAAAMEGLGKQEVREQFMQTATSILGSNQPVELKEQFIRSAAAHMETQASDAPLNARAPFFLASLLDRAGAFDEGKKWLDVAHARSPHKQSILFELGLNTQARGAMDEALAYFKEAYDSAPEYVEAKVHYASALIRAGHDAEAEPIMRELLAADAAANPRIAAAYASRQEFAKIEAIWHAHIEKHPDDAQARFLLAAAYFEGGNSAAAIRELEAAKAAIPEIASQADQLIEQVRARK